MDDELDDQTQTAGLGVPILYKREPLPWLLFVATLLLFLGATLVLVMRANRFAKQLGESNAALLEAQSGEKTAVDNVTPFKARIDDLESQVKAVTAQREALIEKVKGLEAKAAEAAGTAPKKPTPTAPPGVKKKAAPVKKKKK